MNWENKGFKKHSVTENGVTIYEKDGLFYVECADRLRSLRTLTSGELKGLKISPEMFNSYVQEEKSKTSLDQFKRADVLANNGNGPKIKAEIIPADEASQIRPVEPPTIVAPVVDVQTVAKAFKDFQEIKRIILDEKEDFMEIGGNKMINKSGLRKLRVPFNLSVKMIQEERVEIESESGDYEWRTSIRVTAPNGAYMDAVGSCNTLEDFAIRQRKGMAKRLKCKADEVPNEALNHFIRAMAFTRAENRGLLSIIGGSGGFEEDMGEE